MKTLKEIKESNKSILLYNEKGYLVLTEKNVQTDEIVMEYINKATDADIIEVSEDDEIITVILQTNTKRSLIQEWAELNKKITMSETSSITSDMELQKIKEMVLEETKRLYLEWACDFSFFDIIGEVTDYELDKYIKDDSTFHRIKNEVMIFCKTELEKL